MKHDQFNQGWREANHMNRRELIGEWLAVVASYIMAIGLMVIVVRMLAK